ncbi:hypothetical protein J8F10_27350 [Gemmata sp. G18]|uniref:Uncharacterized protein n=1 Tax=Gemmata palustris TaxID=2822762 RepID=A0ABS5C015_9BACT|nr:hypothetical protein [Gemmata palustris]MBP3958977.1 hypothetical protein [Gemmata palustris]
MATAPSPNDLTRQQLDELDALLQKMLMVPLAPTDAPAPPPPPMAQPPLPPSWRIDAPAPAPSLAHLAIDEPPASLKFEPPAPVLLAPVAKTPKPAPPISTPVPAPKSVPVPAPVVKVTPPPVPVTKSAPVPLQPKVHPLFPVPAPVALTPAPPMPPVPFVFLPLVALNGLFDNICGMFGPPGRLIRSGFVKNLLGFAGLGLIAYTILRVAQVQGWLSLPVVLPWPK